MSDQYFATLPIEELGSEILKRVDNYNEYLMTSGKAALWAKSYDAFYRGGLRLGEMGTAGEQGEYITMDVNHYKSLLTNLITLTAVNKPAFDPRAINTDTESSAQCKLASGLLDYYLREKKVERYLKSALKFGLMYGEGFVVNEWNSTGGKEYGTNPETGAKVKEGDLDFDVLPPHFVARDFSKISSDKHDWKVLTRFENKYNLAAKYPELLDRITGLSMPEDLFIKLRLSKTSHVETDDIPVYTFYHEPNDILPQGRMVEVLASDLVVFDGPLPYREVPIFRLAPENEDFSIFGYTVAYDLLSLQDAINNLYSTVATNQSTFGIQNILIPRGFNISVNSLTGGLNAVEYDPKIGKPEPLQMTLTAPEIFNFIKDLEKLMETLSGVNSVARGNPEASLKSGAALALVQSMAIQFNSGLQQSYMQLNEDIGTSMINILKDFAEVPRIAMIAGKFNQSYMKEFSGKDLHLISRVLVDSGNPLSKTMAGKMQLADTMLQNGLIKNAEQYLEVLATGNLDNLLESSQKKLYQIREENEMLANGEKPTAIITDDHALHINEHNCVTFSSSARKDPNILRAAFEHQMEHIQMLKTADPTLLQILGQQPVPQSAPPGPGSVPAVNGAPQPGPEAPPPGAQGGPVTNPLTNEVNTINAPNMPKNPLTGEKVNGPV